MASVQVTLTGGSPWGLTMIGGKDFHQPLTIGKVKPNGKASHSGIIEGYVIEKVNGVQIGNLTHHEAQNVIKSAGFTLTLTLRKPSSRETQPEAISESKPSPVLVKHISSTIVQSPSYNQGDNDSGSWQNGAKFSQSPALYAKTHAPEKATSVNGKRPSMTITSDIKQMIEEEEKESVNLSPGSRRASGIKTWHPEKQSENSHSNPLVDRSGGEREKAASNIGSFFQGSSSPRYGEPTFIKALRDIAGVLGEPAVLEIRLGTNLPVPSVHWYHNNKPLRESKDKDIRFLSNGPINTVVLGELTTDLLGTFTCTIMNKNGSRSCRCCISLDKSKPQNESPVTYPAQSAPLSPTSKSNRVVASTSLGLYSNKNVQETYHGQVNRRTSRDGDEESEVMKVLREGPPKTTSKTPSMKFLEKSLLPDSGDL